MLEEIKNSMRISGNDFDNEVQDLIDAAKEDLVTSGIARSSVDDENPLIKKAIINFCKAEFGYDNPDSEKFRNAYESLKAKMSIVYKTSPNEEV